MLWGIVEPARAWDGTGNRLRVRVLSVSDTYHVFIEHTITRVPSGFSGYIRLDTKILSKIMNSELPFLVTEMEFDAFIYRIWLYNAIDLVYSEAYTYCFLEIEISAIKKRCFEGNENLTPSVDLNIKGRPVT